MQDARVIEIYYYRKLIRPFTFFFFSLQAVSTEEGQALAKEYKINFFEASAKQDINVEKSFLTIASEVKERLISDGGGLGPSSGGHRLAPGSGVTATRSQLKGCC